MDGDNWRILQYRASWRRGLLFGDIVIWIICWGIIVILVISMDPSGSWHGTILAAHRYPLPDLMRMSKTMVEEPRVSVNPLKSPWRVHPLRKQWETEKRLKDEEGVWLTPIIVMAGTGSSFRLYAMPLRSYLILFFKMEHSQKTKYQIWSGPNTKCWIFGPDQIWSLDRSQN